MADIYIDTSVQKVISLHKDTLSADRHELRIKACLLRQAETLFKAHRAGDDSVLFHLACWYPPCVGLAHEQIMNTPLTLDQAQLTIAREHGYADWSEVDSAADQYFDNVFENCVDDMLHGNVSGLNQALTEKPALATQTSQYGHKATLLHYLAANGVESHRQITPLNAAQSATTLLKAGADANAVANIYSGSRVLGLLLTSAHPANAGVTDEVARVLRDYGATD